MTHSTYTFTSSVVADLAEADATGYSVFTTPEDERYVDETGEPIDAIDEVGIDDLAPFGVQVRPNGVSYHPRRIGGHEDIAMVRDARDRREHILFDGPPGTGKSALAEAAFACDATDTHDGMETIIGTADTTEADFLGTFVQDPVKATFKWVPGPLQRSIENDVPLFIDEIASIDPRVLTIMYPLMDGRRVLRVPMNPELPDIPVKNNWFVMAAYNPHVPGVHLSEALRDRFEHHVEVGTDWDLAQELGVDRDIITLAKHLNQDRMNDRVRWSPQLRTLLSYQRTKKHRGQSFALSNMLSKAPEEDRAFIQGKMETKFGPVNPLMLGGRFS